MLWLVEKVNYSVIILFIICVLLRFLTWFITQYLDLKWLISYRYTGTSVKLQITDISVYWVQRVKGEEESLNSDGNALNCKEFVLN